MHLDPKTLYDSHAERLYAHCWVLVGEEAPAAVRETFAAAARHAPPPRNVALWLHGMARAVCARRGAFEAAFTPGIGEGDDPLRRAAAALRADHREILLLAGGNWLEPGDIARLLDIAPDTARELIGAARSRFERIVVDLLMRGTAPARPALHAPVTGGYRAATPRSRAGTERGTGTERRAGTKRGTGAERGAGFKRGTGAERGAGTEPRAGFKRGTGAERGTGTRRGAGTGALTETVRRPAPADPEEILRAFEKGTLDVLFAQRSPDPPPAGLRGEAVSAFSTAGGRRAPREPAPLVVIDPATKQDAGPPPRGGSKGVTQALILTVCAAATVAVAALWPDAGNGAPPGGVPNSQDPAITRTRQGLPPGGVKVPTAPATPPGGGHAVTGSSAARPGATRTTTGATPGATPGAGTDAATGAAGAAAGEQARPPGKRPDKPPAARRSAGGRPEPAAPVRQAGKPRPGKPAPPRQPRVARPLPVPAGPGSAPGRPASSMPAPSETPLPSPSPGAGSSSSARSSGSPGGH